MKRLLAVLLLFAAACTSEKPAIADADATQTKPAAPAPPSPEQARDLIANSADFGEYEFTNAGFTLPVSGAAMNEPARVAAKELAAAGWLALEGTGDIALTDKSRADKRFLLRPNGLLDIVPLAKKEMGAVTAVRPNDDGTVMVDFTWRWIANEVGTSFLRNQYEGTHNATATLFRENSEWRVLKITAT